MICATHGIISYLEKTYLELKKISSLRKPPIILAFIVVVMLARYWASQIRLY